MESPTNRQTTTSLNTSSERERGCRVTSYDWDPKLTGQCGHWEG